ncbi:class I SAM-dependent methyltransferase [Chloroflexota bacterium]
MDQSGIISLEGWYRSQDLSNFPFPSLSIGNKSIPIYELFRTYRPDVSKALNLRNDFLGIQIIFLHNYNKENSFQQRITLEFKGKDLFDQSLEIKFSKPDYYTIFETHDVLDNDSIYGSGPPSPLNSDEIISLVQSLKGPILDFGCGNGYLIKVLRENGEKAFGIEVNREDILNHLLPEIKKFITIYNGSFPLPFADNIFQSVIASEVIEHIPNYEEAISEISRITNQRFIITVPDITSIPKLFHDNVVPWHLLEATHVNFFTIRSLSKILYKYFDTVTFLKIGPSNINDTMWHISIGAICEKH